MNELKKGWKMESKLQSLSWQRVFLLVLHYFLGYGFLYRQIGVFLTLANDPYAIMILPSIQLCIYLFTLAWVFAPKVEVNFLCEFLSYTFYISAFLIYASSRVRLFLFKIVRFFEK